MLRRRLPNHILVVVAAAALVACSDSTALPGDDASIGNPDGAPDGAGEAAPDATPDTTHDGPDGTDASPDVDARPDTGPDGSPPDADLDARDDADAPPPSCILEESSTLPGVRFAFRTSTCTFTLAQAMSGISIPYDLVVEHDVLGFVPGQPYWYGSDAANLDINEVLSGGTQNYCLCDIGLPYSSCPLADGGSYHPDGGSSSPCEPVTIPTGVYHRVFTWDGHNWNGPSDTANPKGALFPAGDYELKITTSAGSIGDSGALGAIGRMRVRLVP